MAQLRGEARDEPEVIVSRESGVLTITLNRPHVRNAINHNVAVEIARAVDELEQDDTIAVAILAGAGPAFCSGMDLKAFLRGERPVVDGRGFAGLTMRPPTKPLVAAVEGPALAGGCELVLACDLVVAGRTATFGLPEVKRGLVAAAGGLLRLPQRVPYQIALEAALTGDLISADRAHSFGLVNVLVDDGEALRAAQHLASRIAANAPLAVRASKRIVLEQGLWAPDRVWEEQEAIVAPVRSSDDAREGATAFAEKRAPRWRSC
jgi:enoyl-CoA hydratase/carnithine racemase